MDGRLSFRRFCLGAGFVPARLALEWMPPWVGAAYSIPAATAFFWCVAHVTIDITRIEEPAAMCFACGGVLMPAVVALLIFERNRLARANLLLELSPGAREPFQHANAERRECQRQIRIATTSVLPVARLSR